MMRIHVLATAALVLGLAACQAARETSAVTDMPASGAMPVKGMTAPHGALLAYEHEIAIELAADAIPARLAEAQAGCSTQKFGDCSVLKVQQQGGEYPTAGLTVRIAPAGVEPLIALASRNAHVGSRSTRAEDLAQVVQDTAQQQARLQGERARLLEFQQRRDLAVADMIALSKQLAQVEAQLQVNEREAAQHARRLDTNLLTLNFHPPGGESGRNEIAQAFRDFGRTLSMGTAWTIRALAFLIPLGVVLVGLVMLIRRLRRR